MYGTYKHGQATIPILLDGNTKNESFILLGIKEYLLFGAIRKLSS